MNRDITVPAVRIPGHPIFRILVSFPIALFSGALVTDIVYAITADMLWADFSAWMLAVAMVMGGLAAIAGIGALIADRHIRPRRPAGIAIIGSVLVLAIGLLNNFVHSRDAWTSVVPFGLALSAVTVIIMLITAWLASAPVYEEVPVVPYGGVRS